MVPFYVAALEQAVTSLARTSHKSPLYCPQCMLFAWCADEYYAQLTRLRGKLQGCSLSGSQLAVTTHNIAGSIDSMLRTPDAVNEATPDNDPKFRSSQPAMQIVQINPAKM